MAVFWNSADKSAFITLSNGDLTATRNSGSAHVVARATQSRSTGAGNWFYTMAPNLSGGGNIGIGLATASEGVDLGSSYLGNSANSLGWFSDAWRQSNTNSGTTPGSVGYTTSDLVGIGMAGTTVTLYKWNGSSWTLVDTLTGWLGAGSWFPAIDMRNTSDAGTANFGATAMNVPSGFRSWDDSQPAATAIIIPSYSAFQHMLVR